METILGDKSQATHIAASSAHLRHNMQTKSHNLVPRTLGKNILS